MSAWLSLIGIAFLTALRFAIAPAFVLLVGFSLVWKSKQGTWLPLWKLAVPLVAIAVLSTLFFAFAWHDTVYP